MGAKKAKKAKKIENKGLSVRRNCEETAKKLEPASGDRVSSQLLRKALRRNSGMYLTEK
jgi:hypothetical protein